MAGSISLLHEAVRLEANRENFKALTKYLGALAAVSHALLEICENGSDALYTSIFEEKLGIVSRCYDRISFLFGDLTKPDPAAATTIASAGVLAAVARRNSRKSTDGQNNGAQNFTKRPSCSNGPLYENLPANSSKYSKKSDDEGSRVRSGRRYRQSRALSNGANTKKSEGFDHQKSIDRFANRLDLQKLQIIGAFRNSTPNEEPLASPTLRHLRDNSSNTAISMNPSSPATSAVTSSFRMSRASYDHNSNFGTILTALNLQNSSSVFYDVPTSTQSIYARPPHQTLGGEYDSDIEADRELPQLQDIIGAESVRHLTDKERKRQQAIIELFHIERMHVGRLKVMYRVFYKPLAQNQLLSRNFVDFLPLNILQLLFANIEEILQVHMAINRAMKSILKERRLVTGVGDLMVNFLDNANGDQMRNAAVTFCQYQQYALDMLRTKRKDDKKFGAFLEKAESNPMCRGFPLRDLLPGEMKHLSRYPLLLENILKYTPEHWDETRKLRHCVKCAKDILHAVNSAKRNFDNSRRLCEIRDKLDMNPFYVTNHQIALDYQNFDLTKHNLVFDGNLKWRIGKKTVDVYAIVLDSILLLLTISDYDRYRMMFYELRVSGANGRSKKMGPVKFSPLLELIKVSPRMSPTDERAFYLICKIPPYAFTYELVAPSIHERRTWIKIIGDQSDVCKRQEFSPPIRSLTNAEHNSNRHNSHSSTLSSGNDSRENLYEKIDSCSSCNSESDSDIFTNVDEYSTSPGGCALYDTVPTSDPNSNELAPLSTYRKPSVVENYETSGTVASFKMSNFGSPFDQESLIGKLFACEKTIFQEMKKRQEILALIFDLPRNDFSNIAELVSSPRGGPKTMSECLLAATEETNKLLSLVHWNENSWSNSARKPLSEVHCVYEQPTEVRRRGSLSIDQPNWIQHCLVPDLIPSLLALMKYLSTMVQLLQCSTSNQVHCDTLHVKL